MKKVAVIVGSLRKDSLNRKLAEALVKIGHPDLQFEMVDIASVPLYNQDMEEVMPAPVTALKDKIEASDIVLMVTPEYNRSVPGVLKNVLDWVSRPYGSNSLAGKIAATAGMSPGGAGTAVCQSHLRSFLPMLGMDVFGPEMYISGADGYFGADGLPVSETTRDFLRNYLKKLAAKAAR